ncbi:phosphopantetheine-binding protein [Nonomuraea sp. NPDC055795]
MRDEVLPVARANAADLPWGIYQIDVATCLAYLAAGRPGLAAALAADGYREGSPMMTTGWALYGGIAAAVQGELERADALLGEAVAGFGAHDTFRLLRCCLMAHAWVHALRGDPAATTLMARADALDNRTNQVFEPWITSWRAWVASCEGDTAAALRHAETAAELAAAAGAPIVEALARYDRSRLAGIPDLPSLARLTGRTASGPSALGRIADDLAGLGYHLHAAELAAAAARTPRTALAATKAAELRARHPGARTPLLDATAPAHDVLTPREPSAAAGSPVEDVLAELWAGLLGLDRVGIDDDFFALGGDSLTATRVLARVNEALDVDLPLGALMSGPNVRELAAQVTAARSGGRAASGAPPAPRTRRPPLPLSYTQQRFWFMEQIEPGTAVYTVPLVLRLRGRLAVPGRSARTARPGG